jgi:hypothetical protein
MTFCPDLHFKMPDPSNNSKPGYRFRKMKLRPLKDRLPVACASIWLLAVLLPSQLRGQANPPTAVGSTEPRVPSPFKAVNEAIPSWLCFSGEFRDRAEGRTAYSFKPSVDDAYDLTRLRLNLEVTPQKWVRVFIQGQDTRALGIDASRVSSSLKDIFDLRQAYIEIKTGERDGVSLRVGRQELIFGAEHLVGASDWTNTARSFDGVRLGLAQGRARVDIFAASVVAINMTSFDQHIPGQNIYGAYASFTGVVPKSTFQPYFLSKTLSHVESEEGRAGNANIYTAGFRWTGSLPAGFDYAAEMAKQMGHYSNDDVAAWAGDWIAGYTVARAPGKPRFSTEYDYATGDTGQGDGRVNTFDQLYPTNHSYYGIADMEGWRNLRDLRMGASIVPHRKLKLTFDYNWFWLASAHDGLYNASGALIVKPPAGGTLHRDIGSEADVIFTYNPAPQITIGSGFAHLFPGRFLLENSPGSGTSYSYVFCAYRF